MRRRTTTEPQQSGTGATFRDGDLNTAHVTAAVEAKYPGTKSRRTAGARTTMASECNDDVRENRRDGGRGAVAEHYPRDLGVAYHTALARTFDCCIQQVHGSVSIVDGSPISSFY